jgi:hypothetical protein
MFIKNKYKVGHIYYAPRVYPNIKKETKVIDGKIYIHEEPILEIVIKKRIIDKILITITDNNVKINYYGRDFKDFLNMDYEKHVAENDLKFTNEKTSHKFAENWLKKEKKPYYG